MTHKGARRFGLVLLLALACAEAGPEQRQDDLRAAATPDDDDVLAMVPAEAELVLWADLGRLRVSPWTRDSFDKMAASAPEARASIDQMVGMDRVVLAKLPSLRDGASVVIAQGAFDRERMRRGFADGGEPIRASNYRGADVLERGEEALAFLGKRTVLSGLTVAVRAALDCNLGVARTIEAETWVRDLRAALAKNRGAATPVVTLYVHLQPATREQLVQDLGEGGTLEYFAGRIDLDRDLDVVAVGVLRSEQEARDMAARLTERLRQVRNRPIVAAFGLGSVIDDVQLTPRGNDIEARLHVSERERTTIAERMKVVADTIANLRKQRERTQEKDKP
jgi:hypothetical protein